MNDILAELEYNEVITSNIVSDLRRYIYLNNPDMPPDVLARIFADAINIIVDIRVPNLPEANKARLKEILFRDAVSKSIFRIDCSDIFMASLRLKITGYKYFKEMGAWLCNTLRKRVSRESLFSFAVRVHGMIDVRPDADINEIVRMVQQETGGLRYEDAASPFVNLAGTAVHVHPITYLKTAVSALARMVPLIRLHGRTAAITALAAAVISVFSIMEGTFGNTPVNETGSLASIYDITLPPYKTMDMPAVSTGISGLYGIRGLKMRATAYDLSYGSCGKKPGDPEYGITFTGTRAAAGRTVAVDPEVIPLGSRVCIEFPGKYDYLDGIYVAEDTGSSIKGNMIDVFFGEDRDGSTEVNRKAMEFGVRYVYVRLLD